MQSLFPRSALFPSIRAVARTCKQSVSLVRTPFAWSAFIIGTPGKPVVNQLQAAFTGPLAQDLSLVGIVVGGLLFAFDEGESKRTIAGIVFDVGMAIGAVNFMSWLSP